MTDTAQLLSRLRSSFATSNRTLNAYRPGAVSSGAKVAPATAVTQSDALQVLDQVLQEVEQNLVTQVAVAPVPPFPPPAAGSLPTTEPTFAEPTAYTEPIEPIESVQPTESAAPAQISDPGVLAQAVPAAALQTTDQLNPQHHVLTSKESAAGGRSNEITAESGTGLQYVEQEKTPEIPVEVESYLQKIEEQTDQAPREIVVADGTDISALPVNTPTQPVIVLPITPAVEQTGGKKNTRWSIRWLVEWSRKIMKMFMGKVIYREEAPVSAS